jgi:hypothetical protein
MIDSASTKLGLGYIQEITFMVASILLGSMIVLLASLLLTETGVKRVRICTSETDTGGTGTGGTGTGGTGTGGTGTGGTGGTGTGGTGTGGTGTGGTGTGGTGTGGTGTGGTGTGGTGTHNQGEEKLTISSYTPENTRLNKDYTEANRGKWWWFLNGEKAPVLKLEEYGSLAS